MKMHNFRVSHQLLHILIWIVLMKETLFTLSYENFQIHYQIRIH